MSQIGLINNKPQLLVGAERIPDESVGHQVFENCRLRKLQARDVRWRIVFEDILFINYIVVYRFFCKLLFWRKNRMEWMKNNNRGIVGNMNENFIEWFVGSYLFPQH